MPYNKKKYILIFLIAMLVMNVGRAIAIDIDNDNIDLYGYIHLMYNDANNELGNVNGSFSIRHLNFHTDLHVNDQLVVKSALELEDGVDTEKGFGSVNLEYGFFEYFGTNNISYRGGKLLLPFGYFNEVRDSTTALIAIRVPDNLYWPDIRGGFDFFPEYNGGLGVNGYKTIDNVSYPLEIFYSLYVGNGESAPETNQSSSDDNKNKSISGRVFVSIYEATTIGLSFYTGEKSITKDRDSLHNTIASTLIYDNGFFNIINETGYTKFNEIEEFASYIQTHVTLYKYYLPYYRYEYFDPNDSIEDDIWQTHTIGLKYTFLDNMSFKGEVSRHEIESNNSMLASNNKTVFNEITVAVDVSF